MVLESSIAIEIGELAGLLAFGRGARQEVGAGVLDVEHAVSS